MQVKLGVIITVIDLQLDNADLPNLWLYCDEYSLCMWPTRCLREIWNSFIL